MTEFAIRPASLETTSTSVYFRSGSDVIPTCVQLNYEAASRVIAVAVGSDAYRDGLGVLITIDEARRLCHALGLALDMATPEGSIE